MCQWPRPTWTAHLFSGVTVLQPTAVSFAAVFEENASLQWSSGQHPVHDWAKGERLGACPQRTPTFFNCRHIMAKQSLFSAANSVLLQALKTIWQNENSQKVECFDIIIYSKDTDNSVAHKFADMTQSAGAILSSSLSTKIWRSFFWLQIDWSQFVLTLPQHYALALHITRYNYLCQFFIHVCRFDAAMTLAKILGNHVSTILGC